MEKKEFHERLLRASERVLAVARTLVIEELYGTFCYCVIMPQEDNNALKDGKEFLKEKLPSRLITKPLDADAVVDFLWQEGNVPTSIEIAVASAEDGYTLINLRCSTRYSSLESPSWKARHTRDSLSLQQILPFLPRIPVPPRSRRIVEKGLINFEKSIQAYGKFHLNR